MYFFCLTGNLGKEGGLSGDDSRASTFKSKDEVNLSQPDPGIESNSESGMHKNDLLNDVTSISDWIDIAREVKHGLTFDMTSCWHPQSHLLVST